MVLISNPEIIIEDVTSISNDSGAISWVLGGIMEINKAPVGRAPYPHNFGDGKYNE